MSKLAMADDRVDELARDRKRKFCSHCGEMVSRTTYYRHRDSYAEPAVVRIGASLSGGVEDDSHQELVLDNDLTVTMSESLEEDYNLSSSEDESDGEEPSEEAYEDNEGINEILEESDEDEEETQILLNPLIKSLLVFLFVWQSRYRVSEAAVTSLITFLYNFFSLLEVRTGTSYSFPKSLDSARKLLKLSKSSFCRYVVCGKCEALYDRNWCLEKRRSEQPHKYCENVLYPNHRQVSRRKPCGMQLTKIVSTRLVPMLEFYYQSLKSGLERMVCRPGFIQKCELWRNRQSEHGILSDIFDGETWSSFKVLDGKPFLTEPMNFLFALNVDWFKPFTRSQYSIGVMYLTTLNLPREDRYKSENNIIVGIIPGPKEPKGVINSYLAPLVNELLQFMQGVSLNAYINSQIIPVKIRAALGCVSCDVPACRKVAGFLAHSARLGCSKCLKEFPTAAFGEKPDYSGYDRSQWIPRTNSSHRSNALAYLSADTKSKRKDMASTCGMRYSVLLDLPYFDPIKHVVVDPMHNLLLGTAKHVFEVWMDKGVLTKKIVSVVQERMSKVKVPGDIGRLPSHGDSVFSYFTADQWRNWVLVYSLICIKGLVGEEHYCCWQLFVLACYHLLVKGISQAGLNKADELLVRFCNEFQSLYGDDACTPNMHLHLHLRECVVQYGPVYAFWCFGYERFNGLLESYHTNMKKIESQLLRKFLEDQRAFDLAYNSDNDGIKSCISKPTGTLKLVHQNDLSLQVLQELASYTTSDSVKYSEATFILVCNQGKTTVIDYDKYSLLEDMYSCLYPTIKLLRTTQFIEQYGKIECFGEDIHSTSVSIPGSIIMAHWMCDSHICCTSCPNAMRAGRVQYVFSHQAVFREQGSPREVTHYLAYVRWYEDHQSYDWFGEPVLVVSQNFTPINKACFIPVKRIAFVCASLITSIDDSSHDNVLAIVPLNRRVSLK